LKRFWETGKTVLIFVLIASSVFLADRTGYFDEFIDSTPALSSLSGWLASLKSTPSPPSGDSEISMSEAARPLYAVVTGIGGHHYGIKYDSVQLSALYYTAANILGEALGSSSEPQAITEGAWRAAITSAGIYFDYLTPMPLSALTGWLLGADMSHGGAEHSARRICISGTADGGVYLYYIASDGAFYRSDTAVQYAYLAPFMTDYLPNNTHYAFELGENYRNIDPYALIMPGRGQFPSISLSNPTFDRAAKKELLVGFGMNPYITPYNESTGAVVYVADDCSLRLYPSAIAVYKTTGDTEDRLKIEYSGLEPGVNEMLEGARSFVLPLIGSSAGSAELYYTGYARNSDGSYTFTFDYFVSSIPVRLSSSSHAAIIKITDGVITEAKLCFKTFSAGSGYAVALPDLQAALLADEEGGEPVLEFYETGTGILTTQWTSR